MAISMFISMDMHYTLKHLTLLFGHVADKYLIALQSHHALLVKSHNFLQRILHRTIHSKSAKPPHHIDEIIVVSLCD